MVETDSLVDAEVPTTTEAVEDLRTATALQVAVVALEEQTVAVEAPPEVLAVHELSQPMLDLTISKVPTSTVKSTRSSLRQLYHILSPSTFLSTLAYEDRVSLYFISAFFPKHVFSNFSNTTGASVSPLFPCMS